MCTSPSCGVCKIDHPFLSTPWLIDLLLVGISILSSSTRFGLSSLRELLIKYEPVRKLRSLQEDLYNYFIPIVKIKCYGKQGCEHTAAPELWNGMIIVGLRQADTFQKFKTVLKTYIHLRIFLIPLFWKYITDALRSRLHFPAAFIFIFFLSYIFRIVTIIKGIYVPSKSHCIIIICGRVVVSLI